MRSLSSVPAAGSSSGLPAIHHVASSDRQSSAPSMSFELKREMKASARALFSARGMDTSDRKSERFFRQPEGENYPNLFLTCLEKFFSSVEITLKHPIF